MNRKKIKTRIDRIKTRQNQAFGHTAEENTNEQKKLKQEWAKQVNQITLREKTNDDGEGNQKHHDWLLRRITELK